MKGVKQQQLKNKSEQSKRRKALKVLSIGGAVAGVSNLPGRWTKPVIDSIVLPVHAETTDDSGNLGAGVTPAPTTTAGSCSVSCQIDVNLEWSHLAPNSGYRNVVLEVLTPGGTRISPNHAQQGRCLQLNNHDGAAQYGAGHISDINGNVAPGRYQLFLNIGSGVGTGNSVDVTLNAQTCGDSDNDGRNYQETGPDTGLYSAGSINVSQGGTTSVRVDL